MTFASFGNNGYDYCDEGRYVLFSADKTHEFLFKYVSKDLSELSTLLETYVSKRMDIVSFELSDRQHSDSDYKKIIGLLKSVHPYYNQEYKAVFMQAFGEYLNALLINSKYRERYSEERNKVEWKEWYFEKFRTLTSHCLITSDNIEKFYDEYLSKTGYDVSDNVEDALIHKTLGAKGFSSEIRTQEAVKWMLFFILDVSVPGIKDLTSTWRAWLYERMFKSVVASPDVEITTRRSYSPAALFRKKQDRSQEVANLSKLQDLCTPVYEAFKTDHIDYDNLTPKMLETLSAVSAYPTPESVQGTREECTIDSLHQLLYLEIMLMAQAGTEIKRCRHCKMYFIVTDRKEAYCDRKSKATDEICSEVGSRCSWQTKIKEDPLLKAYNRARKTHHARIKYGIMTDREYKSWVAEAKLRLDETREKVKNGETDISEFETWLKR